jgi:hypothetical protein
MKWANFDFLSHKINLLSHWIDKNYHEVESDKGYFDLNKREKRIHTQFHKIELLKLLNDFVEESSASLVPGACKKLTDMVNIEKY